MEEIFRPWYHEHPMSRMGAGGRGSWLNWCGGCSRYFIGGEAAYGCRRSECEFPYAFHKECLEMPTEIRHGAHPSHKLSLDIYGYGGHCAVCDDDDAAFGKVYRCREGCDEVWIHMGCAGGLEEVDGAAKDTMKHSSHPQHLLRFSKKTTPCCDACGTDEKAGNSYVCTVCDYSIHESCALLAESAHFPQYHSRHSLSLAYYPPYEYIKYEFECAICKEALRLRRWVYHCQLCRYVVHIKCATDASLAAPLDSHSSDNDEEHIIKAPVEDVYKEIIRPFVMRERGEMSLLIDGKFDFSNHRHPLTFTPLLPSSSSSHDDHNEEEEEEEDDDDDDDDEDINKSSEVVTCDGCTLPINENEEDNNGYMSCDECKYFLHLACFNSPTHLPSHPLHPLKGHSLTLRNAGKLTDWISCYICDGWTNGLYYSCDQCYFNFKIDIKCASLPSAIKHAAHPQHRLNLHTDANGGFCGVCYNYLRMAEGFYTCGGCRFSMCGGCVLLPARNKHSFDKHCLPLTYDAYVHHRGDFYCGSCEDKMHPKKMMYYCRDCDQSFHPKCFPATSGRFRNIKYGKYQVSSAVHHHPLRFQIITKKMRCDLCRETSYDEPGFQCDSCNFAMCLDQSRFSLVNENTQRYMYIVFQFNCVYLYCILFVPIDVYVFTSGK